MDNSAEDIATLEGIDGGALVPTNAAESSWSRHLRPVLIPRSWWRELVALRL